mmetsp:Transcript_8423/g.21712  ORF Transcript_8423/g.21712 Transcript_8423/m.21712 type:complete len:495 (-) Transcript_8423:69-1553(-)|eukprot:CAMPEP_0198240292 /NCGR_PEP_ID=MMETSP1446-20131203/5462_1 /TAXON_ID=1461542 ORGANISM="Unidentified sp, Strain CCMP2111" /NCGR_SAMPLE_ID=MMETSP1446 /ASSEMBLY_ACC=CAM_ASM_001112 /LENGTH=494 /DNA_ID=CAMNT_0043923011 /DNA_START=180 /DNA_END=1664 /DNA_ORIENTATION=+
MAREGAVSRRPFAGKVAAAATVTVAAACVVAYEAHKRGWADKWGVRWKQTVGKTQVAIKDIAETAHDTAQTVRALARDAKDFLSSDSKEIPQSLRQAIKLASCSETTEAIQTHLKAAVSVFSAPAKEEGSETSEGTYGTSEEEDRESVSTSEAEATHDYQRHKEVVGNSSDDTSTSGKERVGARSSSYDILDLAFDRLFSANGAQFVSDVAGNVAREAVATILREYGSADGSGSGSSQGVENVIDKYCKNILCSTQGKRFVSDVLTMMVTQATGVYLDKTLHINTFDQIFDSAVKPQHRPFVEGVCVKMCKAWTHTMLNSPGGEDVPNQAVCSPLVKRELYPALSVEEVCTPTSIPRTPMQDSSTGLETPCESEEEDGDYEKTGHTNGLATTSGMQAGVGVQSWLSCAAKDAEVRGLLVSMSSSAAGAATRVVVESFAPSWLVKSRGRQVNSNGDSGYHSGALSMAAYLGMAFLFVVVAFLLQPSSRAGPPFQG